MKNCKYCGEPIILVPSAQERAKKYGGSPNDYTNMFDYHSNCTLKMRKEATSELINRIGSKGKIPLNP